MYDFEKFNKQLADVIYERVINSPNLYKEFLSRFQTISTENSKKFTPLKADEINVTESKTTTSINSNKNDIANRGVRVYFGNVYHKCPGEVDNTKPMDYETAMELINGLVPVEDTKTNEVTTFRNEISKVGNNLFEKYKDFKGFITIGITPINPDKRFNDYKQKTFYPIKRSAHFWGSTEVKSESTTASTFMDALLMIHAFLENRNSWIKNNKIAPPEFVCSHRFTLGFKNMISGKEIFIEEFSGEVMNYFINFFGFTSSKKLRFTSCVYKGKRYRVIDCNNKSLKLHDDRWIRRCDATDVKTV